MRKGLVIVVALVVGWSLVGCEDEPTTDEAVAEAEEVDEAGETDDDEESAEPEADDEQAADDADPGDETGGDGDFDYPGFDLDELSDDQRAELAELAHVELCPCEDSQVSLHDCMQDPEDDRCAEADEEVTALVDVVTDTEDNIDAFERRAEQRAETDEGHDFALDGVPYKGDRDADVVIVEFADFQCTHCRTSAQVMESVYEQFGDDIAIFFKNFPIGGPVAEQAHRAAMAAHEQGRFWEMHNLLFEHQQQIDQQRIERFARQLGLNFERFRNDMESAEVDNHIQRDRQEGTAAGVSGTPTIYIDGELYTGSRSPQALAANIESRLD